MTNSKIKKACQITVNIFNKLIKELKAKKFKTELDIANFVKLEAKQLKVKLAFPPLIVAGKNAAEIHHIPNKTKLTNGFLIIDIGVKYKGYCSDCTRTVYLGKPTKKEIKIYNLVLGAQETSLMYAQPGNCAADVDLIARAILEPYFKHFVHALGHGVGKDVHKCPVLKPRSNAILKKNQVVTIEPGLYFKNKLGIRIEDTIIVKDNPEILTKLTKKLITI